MHNQQNNEILERLLQIMRGISAVQVDLDKLQPETEIAALGFDSLSMLDLLYDVQQAFKIEIDPDDLASMQTVQDAIALIGRLTHGRQ